MIEKRGLDFRDLVFLLCSFEVLTVDVALQNKCPKTTVAI